MMYPDESMQFALVQEFFPSVGYEINKMET